MALDSLSATPPATSQVPLILIPSREQIKVVLGAIDMVAVAGSNCNCGCSCHVEVEGGRQY